MFDIVLFYIAFVILGWCVIPNKKLGAAISFIGFMLASMDFLCLQIMGQHIDYTTLTRIDGTMLAMAPQVTPAYFYGSVIMLLLVAALHWFAYKHLASNAASEVSADNVAQNKTTPKNKTLPYGLAVLAVICLFFSETGTAYKNILLSAKEMKQNFSMSSEQILSKLGAQGEYLAHYS